MAHVKPGRITDNRGHVMAGVQRLSHDMSAYVAGRSETVIRVWCLPAAGSPFPCVSVSNITISFAVVVIASRVGYCGECGAAPVAEARIGGLHSSSRLALAFEAPRICVTSDTPAADSSLAALRGLYWLTPTLARAGRWRSWSTTCSACSYVSRRPARRLRFGRLPRWRRKSAISSSPVSGCPLGLVHPNRESVERVHTD
jgi:hypothetical protein